jgi:hypothetical protein
MPGMSEKVTVEIQDESDQSPSDEAALEDDHAEALPTSNEGTDDSLQDDSAWRPN